MPIHNWFKIFEDREYRYALIDPSGKLDKYVDDALMILQDNYSSIFGIDAKYIEFMRSKAALELLKIKRAMTGDKSLDLLIQVAEIRLEQNHTSKAKTNSFEAVILINKHMGFPLNQQQTTVFEYYMYVKNLIKHAQEQRKNAKRGVRQKK